MVTKADISEKPFDILTTACIFEHYPLSAFPLTSPRPPCIECALIHSACCFFSTRTSMSARERT